MRFTWHSNAPFTASGYGQQTRINVARLAKAGHEIGVICYHGLEGGLLNLGGYTCMPKRFHPYGNDVIIPHSIAWNARFVLSLTDVWVMNVEEFPPQLPWIPWYPVDHDPMPALVRNKLNHAWRRIAMSKFGVAKTHEAGMDCFYVPHSVETNIMNPGDKSEARARLNLPNDRWIVGTVAMNKGNPSRKNFAEMLTAFAAFRRRHTDAFYFLQTDRGDSMADAVNLPELARNLGLIEGQDYGFCNQYQNATGFAAEYMADLYRSMDVHMLVSAGEGFGIPTLEAQACGTPVIVGDWTASSELCFAGRMVDKKDAEPVYTPLASYQFRPHVRAVELALEAEYKRPTPTAKAVELIQAEYDADMVMEKHWKPIMAEIEGALPGGGAQ